MAEKYTQWADKSCGVNPFVPGEIPLPKQTLMRVGRYLAASLMFLPRMVISFTLILLYCLVQIVLNEMLLLLVSFGLSWLCNTGKIEAKYFTPLVVLLVINLLSVLPFLKFSIVGALRRRLLRSILSVILFSLGVTFAPAWANSARVVGVKMSVEEKALNEKSSPLSAVDAGDLVISNLTNVLEIVYYESSFALSPVYVFSSCLPANLKAPTYNYICHSATFMEAIKKSMSYIPFRERDETTFISSGKPLVAIIAEAKRQGRPVILFVEGVRTNGSGVLEFPSQIFCEMTGDIKVHLSGFVYQSTAGEVSLPCPAGSTIHRIFWSGPGSVTANCLIDRCGVPKLIPVGKASGASATATSAVTEKRLEAWTQELREVFSKLVNKKSLKLSMVDYDSFYEYYVANVTGNTAESKRISDARGGKGR